MNDNGQKERRTAFAYRKADGTIRYAHGILSDSIDVSGRYFVYFDTDKGEERKFRIDAFIGIGEPEDLKGYSIPPFENTTNNKAYNDFDTLDIKSILAKRGVAIEDTENFMVIDLIPELNKAQLKDLICKAAERLALL
ncbi:MAG: SH3 beta-barrel fold-containing protein [Prevotella sp.]|nr:SH3 beta-barrel fold-containing protein [Prevotella sp.]